MHCPVSCTGTKKNYPSLCVGMLNVIDTREQYLHLYCLGILLLFFFLYLFVNLWTKEDFLTPFPLPVQDSEGGAPSASALSLAAVQSARSLGLLCHLEQAKPSARACAAPDRLAFFVLQHPLWNCLCHLCGRSPKIKFKQEELEFLIVTLHDQLAVQIKESGYWRTF